MCEEGVCEEGVCAGTRNYERRAIGLPTELSMANQCRSLLSTCNTYLRGLRGRAVKSRCLTAP